MTRIEDLVAAELERLHPAARREPEWEQVLERVAAGGHVHRRRSTAGFLNRPRPLAVAAVFAAVAIIALVLSAPWKSRPDFLDQALAALGSGRYVHAVAEADIPFSSVINLASGRSRPLVTKIDYVYDTKTRHYSGLTYVNGARTASFKGSPEPVLAAFASGFRKALADHSAKVVGSANVSGRAAKILRFSLGAGDSEEVAVDAMTYDPLWLRDRSVDGHGRPSVGPTYRVLFIRSAAQRPLQLNRNPPILSGGATAVRVVHDPHLASRSIEHTVLWLGRSYSGLTLRRIAVERVTTVAQPGFRPRSSDLGLRVSYSTPRQWLEIEEAPTPQAGYDFYGKSLGGLGPIPPRPYAVLSCDACGESNHSPQYHPFWRAQFRKAGLYVTVRGSSRSRVISAARFLTPVE